MSYIEIPINIPLIAMTTDNETDLLRTMVARKSRLLNEQFNNTALNPKYDAVLAKILDEAFIYELRKINNE